MRRGRGVRFSAGAIALGVLLGACSAERTSVQPVDPPLGEASGSGPSGGPASGGPAVADELFGPAAWVADVAAGGEVLVWNGHVLVLEQDVLTALDAAGSTVWVAETGVNDEALGPAELDEAFLRVLGPDAVAVVRQTPSPNGEWSVSTVTMADGSVTGPTPVTGYPDVGDVGVVFGATMDSPVPRPVDTAWLRPDGELEEFGVEQVEIEGVSVPQSPIFAVADQLFEGYDVRGDSLTSSAFFTGFSGAAWSSADAAPKTRPSTRPTPWGRTGAMPWSSRGASPTRAA